MIIYTQTPDYYQEYLQHGWLKDQAAKVHKYLERWRGKNGKWYYRYKAAAKNEFNRISSNLKTKYDTLKTKYNRHRTSPWLVTKNYGKNDVTKRGIQGQKWTIFDDGRPKAQSGRSANRFVRGWNVTPVERDNYQDAQAGISAGRKRVADKKKAQKQQTLQKIQRDQQSNRARTEKIKSSGYKQGNLSKKGYYNSTSGENSNVVKNSSVVKKVNSNTRNSKNKKSLNNQGYHDSKNTYNSKGDSLYNILTGDNGWPVMFDPTAEGGTRRYKSRTEVWRNLSLPEQYYILYRDNPKKFEQVATPQIREEINKELKKRNMKTI